MQLSNGQIANLKENNRRLYFNLKLLALSQFAFVIVGYFAYCKRDFWLGMICLFVWLILIFGIWYTSKEIDKNTSYLEQAGVYPGGWNDI